MSIHRRLAFLLLCASSVFAMNFADFDTTVQVKTFTLNTSDSTFIPLRNTGFTLSYTVLATNCPNLVARGDFQVRPDSQWLMQLTQDMGDSAFHKQSLVISFCDGSTDTRHFLPPRSKYQLHVVIRKDLKMDTLYTMVTAQLDDSTFTLRVSARSFAPTSVRRRDWAGSEDESRDAFSADGRRIDLHSRIRIDRSGAKKIDLLTN